MGKNTLEGRREGRKGGQKGGGGREQYNGGQIKKERQDISECFHDNLVLQMGTQ